MPSAEDWAKLTADMPATPVFISGADMLVLLGAMQLVLRHPKITADSPTGLVSRAFAEELEKRIVELSPGMADLCKAGWDPAYDVG